MPKLYAISDLHLSYKANEEALSAIDHHPEDSLILAGDIGEKPEHLHTAFKYLCPRFKQLWWVPGNHELYTLPSADEEGPGLRGELKYRECVSICREYDVLTPEDDFAEFDPGEPVAVCSGLAGGTASSSTVPDIGANPPGEIQPPAPQVPRANTKHLICPLFTLYDYSFRPAHVLRDQALDWAREEGVEATDEVLLHNDPHPTRDEWCHTLIQKTHAKLLAARARHPDTPFVLINHWPLTQKLVLLPLIPRFSIWCGSKRTESWAQEFAPVTCVVSGHLHIRRTDWIDGVRFEEVSVGYPRQWKDVVEHGGNMQDLMREILPGPREGPVSGNAPTLWRRFG